VVVSIASVIEGILCRGDNSAVVRIRAHSRSAPG
jgi:hypothetical protein